MDVNTMVKIGTSGLSIASRYAQQAQTTKAADKDTQVAQGAAASAQTAGAGSAYQVELSEAGQSKASETKGLTTDQIAMLQDGITKSQQLMVQTMTAQNLKIQGLYDSGVSQLNFDGVKIDVSKLQLPQVATTPEDAQKAVSDGGDYSVDNVASRIMDFASSIANGDPEKLKQMQTAVENGFSQAGLSWTNATGSSDMPDITQKTHDEVTKRFQSLFDNLNTQKDEQTVGAAQAAAGQTSTASAAQVEKQTEL